MSPNIDSNKLNYLEKEYLSIRDNADKFRIELVRQLNNLLQMNNLILGFPIESRVKSWESIAEKLERVPLNIKSLTDMQDFIGVRLIFLFLRDVKKVCDLIFKEFEVIKQEDAHRRLKEDQFGYSSFHLIIKIPEKWLVVPSLASYGDLKAEIQIRTTAQHLWATASHTLQYKVENSVPEPIRRSIYRVSALLETVDLEFERVLDERDIYRQEFTAVEIGILNADSLEIILDKLLPAKNKSKDEKYGEILMELTKLRIITSNDLKKFMAETLDNVILEEKEIIKERKKSRIFIDKDEERRVLEEGVFFTHTGLVRQALDNKFGRDWRTLIVNK